MGQLLIFTGGVAMAGSCTSAAIERLHAASKERSDGLQTDDSCAEDSDNEGDLECL